METQTLSDDELALQTKQTALAGWLDARPATGGLPDTHHSAPASLQALAVEPFQGAQSELVGYAPVTVTYAAAGPVLGPRAVADARLQVLDDVDPEMRDEAAAAAKPASPRGMPAEDSRSAGVAGQLELLVVKRDHSVTKPWRTAAARQRFEQSCRWGNGRG